MRRYSTVNRYLAILEITSCKQWKNRVLSDMLQVFIHYYCVDSEDVKLCLPLPNAEPRSVDADDADDAAVASAGRLGHSSSSAATSSVLVY